MAKQKGGGKGGQGSSPGLLASLFQFGLHKPEQGRVVRQLTFLAAALIAFLSAYELYRTGWLSNPLGAERPFAGMKYILLIVLSALGFWFSFRIVNYPKFADFLIAVQAEMNKVSWPTRQELWNASVVVMFVIFAMAALLFLFDVIWSFVFRAIHIRY